MTAPNRPAARRAGQSRRRCAQFSGNIDADDLSRIFTGLSRGFDDIVKSGQVRSNLEMTLVRLARRPPLLPLDELLVRLGELEKRLATGAAPPPRGGGGGGSRARNVFCATWPRAPSEAGSI